MKIESTKWNWTREPKDYSITDDKIEIITAPHTDLWQRTYYHFRNDNAPVLQMKTAERYFSFVVKPICEDVNPASLTRLQNSSYVNRQSIPSFLAFVFLFSMTYPNPSCFLIPSI